MTLFEKFVKPTKSLTPRTKRLLVLFPELEWKLRKARIDTSPEEYLAILIAVPVSAFCATLVIMLPIFAVLVGQFNPLLVFGIPLLVAFYFVFYFFFAPNRIINKNAALIDKDLGYMLRDMSVQLSAGIPLFNVLENISVGGYGECSKMADEIVDAIESGMSMTDALNDYGLISPSDYMRRILGQIANALKTGSDLSSALDIIGWSIQLDRENKIAQYGQELAIIGLMYMVLIIVMPSMGVTLFIILSNFFGILVTSQHLYASALLVVGMEMFFISIIRSRRPTI
ncbi:MAG: hypothetical protein B6U72_05515 [Candidatus Altiarchaeales archaeon ex4484_2]|nr:MAG: hypothetical protein B6U72_05515 [Candidatus Altiarchaeales archaeon ex4484_2]